jgi:hypothetical protein
MRKNETFFFSFSFFIHFNHYCSNSEMSLCFLTDKFMGTPSLPWKTYFGSNQLCWSSDDGDDQCSNVL